MNSNEYANQQRASAATDEEIDTLLRLSLAEHRFDRMRLENVHPRVLDQAAVRLRSYRVAVARAIRRAGHRPGPGFVWTGKRPTLATMSP